MLTHVVVGCCNPFVLLALRQSHVASQVSLTLPLAGTQCAGLGVGAVCCGHHFPGPCWPTFYHASPHSSHASHAGLCAHSMLIPVPGPLHLLFPLPGMFLLVWLFFIILDLVRCHFLRCLPRPNWVCSSPLPGTVPMSPKSSWGAEGGAPVDMAQEWGEKWARGCLRAGGRRPRKPCQGGCAHP